jgi:hypothetical protein
MVMPNGLKVGEGIRKDAIPNVRNEHCECRMYGDEFRAHNGAGFFRSCGIYVDGSVGGNVYHGSP